MISHLKVSMRWGVPRCGVRVCLFQAWGCDSLAGDPGAGTQFPHLSNGQHRFCQCFTPGYSVDQWVKSGEALAHKRHSLSAMAMV